MPRAALRPPARVRRCPTSLCRCPFCVLNGRVLLRGCRYRLVQDAAEEEQRPAHVRAPPALPASSEGGVRHGGGERLLLPEGLGAQPFAPPDMGPVGVLLVEGGEPAGKALVNDLVKSGGGAPARVFARVRAPAARAVQVPGQAPQGVDPYTKLE